MKRGFHFIGYLSVFLLVGLFMSVGARVNADFKNTYSELAEATRETGRDERIAERQESGAPPSELAEAHRESGSDERLSERIESSAPPSEMAEAHRESGSDERLAERVESRAPVGELSEAYREIGTQETGGDSDSGEDSGHYVPEPDYNYGGCRWNGDGVCDEPHYCDYGTDYLDCGGGSSGGEYFNPRYRVRTGPSTQHRILGLIGALMCTETGREAYDSAGDKWLQVSCIGLAVGQNGWVHSRARRN